MNEVCSKIDKAHSLIRLEPYHFPQSSQCFFKTDLKRNDTMQKCELLLTLLQLRLVEESI